MLISRTPAQPLSAFVSVLWYAEGWGQPRRRERIMPDGSAGLIVTLAGGGGAIVTGPRSESLRIETSGLAGAMLGVRFSAGGWAAFFPPPLSELADGTTTLEEYIGPAGALLQERLGECAAPGARLDILEEWLGSRISMRSEPDASIVWAAEQLSRPSTRVADVADSIGRSSRWFAGRFTDQVGLTPKVFSRIRRLQTALRSMQREPRLRLASIAASCGYFDQAHMNHEFTRLAGMTPRALFERRTAYPNHFIDGG